MEIIAHKSIHKIIELIIIYEFIIIIINEM